jgi:Zn-dependent protease with chaperone function
MIYSPGMEASDDGIDLREPDDALCARYANTILWLRVGEAVSQFGVLGLLTLTGSSRLVLAGSALTGSTILDTFLYLAAVAGLTRAAALPWSWLSEFVIERRFGLSTQTAWAWLGEWICRSMVTGAAGVLLLLPLALCLPWWPEALVPWFGLVLAARFAYHHWLYPALLHLFYPPRLLRCESFHLPGLGRRNLPVYQLKVSHKTRRVGAYLHLAGPRSAIYVTDTLIYAFSDGEEKVVMAHEFGHLYDRLFLEVSTQAGIEQAQRKLLWSLLQFLGVVLAFSAMDALAPHLGLNGAGDLAGFPLLVGLMMLAAYLLAPLLHAEARRDEADADEYALRITRDVASYRSVMRKLRTLNLDEACSSRLAHFLFDTHPSTRERLRLADEYGGRRARRRRELSARH